MFAGHRDNLQAKFTHLFQCGSIEKKVLVLDRTLLVSQTAHSVHMFNFQVINTPFITGRVRGTCICSSKSYLAVGVTTGTIYILNNETYQQVHMLPLLKETPIHISISPDETYIAGVSASSFVVANITTKQVTQIATSGGSSPVTALTWGFLHSF